MTPRSILEQIYQDKITTDNGSDFTITHDYEQIQSDEDLKDYFKKVMNITDNVPILAKIDDNIVICNGNTFVYDRQFGTFTKEK